MLLRPRGCAEIIGVRVTFLACRRQRPGIPRPSAVQGRGTRLPQLRAHCRDAPGDEGPPQKPRSGQGARSSVPLLRALEPAASAARSQRRGTPVAPAEEPAERKNEE